VHDLHEILEATPSDVAAGLAARLRRYASGSLAGGLFAGPTNVALNRRLVVFNLQSLEEELRPLAMHLIANFVWNRVRRERRPRLLVIDEAWSLLRYPEGGAFISGMARRARKYYLGLVTITQDAADFLRSDHGRAVLVNAAMKLLLKQDATTVDAVADAFQLTPEERQYLLGAGKGEGLLFARGSRLALTIEASPAEHRLATTAPRELAERAAHAANNGVAHAFRT
jgi:type IV secretory pathway VirB4 component